MATLSGTSGADLVIGTELADRVLAAEGDDTLIGAGGNDFLDAGSEAVAAFISPLDTTFAPSVGLPVTVFDQSTPLGSQATMPLTLGTQPSNFVSSGLFIGSTVPTATQPVTGTFAGSGGSVIGFPNSMFGLGLDIAAPGATGFTPVGAGNDVLVGGRGNDTLLGHDGADHFVFDVQPGDANADVISASPGADFVSGLDRLVFDADVFTALGTPAPFIVDDGRFLAGANEIAGRDADDRLVYNTSTGELFYDADGVGGQSALIVATLEGAPALAASDITVI